MARNSGIFNFPIDLKRFIGSMDKNGSTVQTGKVVLLAMQADLNPDDLIESKKISMEFEQEFIYFMGNYSSSTDKKLSAYYFAQRSLADVGNESINEDMSLLSLGFMVVFIYVILMLGKFNSVEQRGYLSLLGILAIILGTGTSYGVCQFCGLAAGPMHGILPFMLLGIGIDDMFVIVQGLDNIHREKDSLRYFTPFKRYDISVAFF